MTYKILFLDIDGTILKQDHTYTDSTKEAIHQVKEKGIEVFLATGRPLHEIGELAEELGVHSFIGYNGAYAEYKNKTIVEEPMKEETIREFLSIAEKHHHELILYTNEKNYLTSMDQSFVQSFLDTFHLTINEPFSHHVINQILSATIINLDPSETSLYEVEADIHLSPVNVEGIVSSYDVIRKTVNKGEAVKQVLKRLNIPKEAAIAFGDGMNDKEMLSSVGEGFAMGNAHPDLFQHAKHKARTVTDSGIYYGLKQLNLLD